jgi:HSP20 family protein
MTIVRWTPLRELESIDRRMRRALEDVGFVPALLPAADVYETDDEFVVELEVPGYEEKELAIEVTDHTVTVTGERKEHTEKEEKEKEKEFRLRERLERHFQRRFALPRDADTEHLTAIFDRGVLEVHAPKAPETRPRKVEIGRR